MEESEEERAERIADVITDRAWAVCFCTLANGYADPDCVECDGQGGWPVEDDNEHDV